MSADIIIKWHSDVVGVEKRDEIPRPIVQERKRLGAPPRHAFPDRAVPSLRRPSLARRMLAKVKRAR